MNMMEHYGKLWVWKTLLFLQPFAPAQGTGPAFRAALWASEEAGLRADRCEMLQQLGPRVFQGFSKGFPMVPIILQWFPIVSDGFEVGLEACRTRYILHKPELTLS